MNHQPLTEREPVVDVQHGDCHVIESRSIRGLRCETPTEETVGGGGDVEGLNKVILLVGAVGGVAFVGGVRERPGPAAGDDVEEDDGQRPDV
jgi:hypothetical protein